MITDSFVLSPDLLLVAPAELDSDAREQFICADNDFILTQPYSRTPSIVVDADTAMLLELFRSPCTIIEAVIQYSARRALEPQIVLDDAFPTLKRLINASVLVSVDDEAHLQITPSIAVGSMLLGCEVMRCVQLVEDIEVYQVRKPDGSFAAAKLLRPGYAGTRGEHLRNEADILRLLKGAVSPVFIDEGTHEGRLCLIMQWCQGVPSDVIAEELRRGGDETAGDLLHLCRSVVDAYVRLHHFGVLHGDVHPRNVLVDLDNSVKLIDFGLAHRETIDAEYRQSRGRGGVGFFFEPEVARARIQGTSPPAPTAAGEQFAIGALLYWLLTGAHYANFAVEELEVMRQIVDHPVVKFVDCGRPAWPEVEAILVTALGKFPEARYASVSDLAARLSEATVPITSQVRTIQQPHVLRRARLLLGTVLERVGRNGSLLQTGGLEPPRASVTYGAAGIAYALYRLAFLQDDPSLLTLADIWLAEARRACHDKHAWINEAIGVTRERIGKISPYHCMAGVHLVEALIGHAMGNPPLQHLAVEGFVAASGDICDNLDLTLGWSGTLLGCALLMDAQLDDASGTSITGLGDAVLGRLMERINGSDIAGRSVEQEYLGVAHGWAGLLYASLRWHQAKRRSVPDVIISRLDELAELGEPMGRGLRWPVRLGRMPGDVGFLAGWCNGSAGLVHLWTAAYQSTGEGSHLTLAERAGWHTWEEPGGIASLCCGLAGRAYALINLYRHTGDHRWLRRARELAARAVEVSDQAQPDSLYKGNTGIALLTAELSAPDHAIMPLFEHEGWPCGSADPAGHGRKASTRFVGRAANET